MTTSSDHHLRIWETPPSSLTLPPDHVHVWKANLLPSNTASLNLPNVLSADELARASRFKFPQHQQAFRAARGILRLILSRYLGIPPQAVVFQHGPHGKPSLAPSITPSFSFNVSHSNNLALYAVTQESTVGIDIEYHRQKINIPALIQRICSSEEKAILTALPPEEQKKGFFACWTKKEAFVKATGKGITIPLEAITVPLPPSNSFDIGSLQDNELQGSSWSLFEIAVDPGYTAALALPRVNLITSYWQWS